MNDLLNDKVAIVTGAGSGIGKSIIEAYARNGAKVVAAGRNEGNCLNVVNGIIAGGGKAVFIRTDVREPSSCQELVDKTLDHFGRLDIACNNAGIFSPPTPMEELDISVWREMIEVNLNSVFYCMRYQVPAMLRNGGGAIINIGSTMSVVGYARICGYVASKHGILGLTKSAAIEFAGRGIRINAIIPSIIHTPMLEKHIPPDHYIKLAAQHPINRLGNPEEVAELAVFLSSPAASFCTGGFYPVDGGYLAQ